MDQSENCHFSISIPARVFVRPTAEANAEWREIEPAPGYYDIEPGLELAVRLQGSDDHDLATLVRELADCPALTELNLSENRNITDTGLTQLKRLPGLTRLNLSSVSLTTTGLEVLRSLTRLTRLDLSYCNKINDLAVKPLKALNRLTYLNLQGCVKITSGGLSKLRRRGLDIHK